jgi:hypothetical protein
MPMSVSLDVRVIRTATSVLNKISDNRELTRNFIVYPNPASDKILVSTKMAYNLVIMRVMDIKGNIVRSDRIIGKFPGEAIVDVTGMKPGIYLFDLYSGGTSETYKVLINR